MSSVTVPNSRRDSCGTLNDDDLSDGGAYAESVPASSVPTVTAAIAISRRTAAARLALSVSTRATAAGGVFRFMSHSSGMG